MPFASFQHKVPQARSQGTHLPFGSGFGLRCDVCTSLEARVPGQPSKATYSRDAPSQRVLHMDRPLSPGLAQP